MNILDTQPKPDASETLIAAQAPAGSAATLACYLSEHLPLGRLRAWTMRGSQSVLQQGLFAGAHFCANVLLARWLGPESYGAFALAYAFFLLGLSLYMALVYEPILVYGAVRYRESLLSYGRILLAGHVILLVPLSLLIVVAAPVIGRFYSHEFQRAFLSLAVVAPLLLLVWLLRGIFYAKLSPHSGVIAGGCYFLGLLFAIGMLHFFGILSPATALGGMGLASLAVSLGWLFMLFRGNQDETRQEPGMRFKVLSDHWSYGKWAMLTALAAWIPANIYYALLPARFGLAGTATLRAVMNLMYPLLHSFTALLTLLIPILVRQRELHGLRRAKRTTMQLIVLYVPVALLYLIIVNAFSKPLLKLLYGAHYSDVPALMVFCVTLLPVTTGVFGLLSSALRSFERPHLVFRGCLVSALTAILVGIPLTLRFGVSGAAAACVVNDLAAIAVLGVCLAASKEVGKDPA